MRVKLSDIKLAIEQVPVGLEGFDIEVHRDAFDNSRLDMTFQGANNKLTTVTVYEVRSGITPEIKQVTKLYKKI